jgi:signal transduction histidine kinase/HPt (histidine-containing phosphotransfer) domain-containing protein/ActR/RegA family two-component response regulator
LIDRRLLSCLRAALSQRLAASVQGNQDLQGWRNRLLDGLCVVAFWLGLLVALPSMWASARQGHWPLIVVDLVAIAAMALLSYKRGIAYRWRAGVLLVIAYLIAVTLLLSMGPLSQIYLLAVPVLCTVLIGSTAAMVALVWCSATLFVAGYVGGIQPGLAVMVVSPLMHWIILSVNFLLVAAMLSVSCAYLLHGLAGALVREREIHLRNAESLAAQRAAEVSNQLKSDFLAMISHEVRTPLGGVIGMLRSALKDAGLPHPTRDKLRLSLSNAEVLLQIINDILDFSRLEAGKMPLEELDFDLPGLLREVVDLLADRAEAKGISLVAEIQPELHTWWRGDPTRLRQVVVNLVGNGIKFTQRGEVSVSVGIAAQPGQGIVISVRDSGIGIEAEALGRLFQKFEQADAATSRKYGGAGLGLAICKNIVSAMGGRIEVSSVPGVGSEFRVMLPLGHGVPAPVAPAEPLRPHKISLAVLCAEDGSINQLILRELLGFMGHTITIVEDGMEALEALAARDYDLVIMDDRMPRMDGHAALKRLRAGLDGVRNAALPVIALTANAAPEDRQRFLAAGANGFLPKPIDENELHSEITRQLEALLAQGRPLVGERRAGPAESKPTSAALDAMFGVTTSAGAQRPEGSDRLYRAMRAAFLIEGPRLLEVAQQGLEQRDAATVALAAHRLMGAVAYLGADTLHARCAKIERLADSAELDALAPHLAALRQELTLALQDLAPGVPA